MVLTPLPSAHTSLAARSTFILHCCDIGAQTSLHEQSARWTELILGEFVAQATEEARLGLPVTPHMLNLSTSRARAQQVTPACLPPAARPPPTAHHARARRAPSLRATAHAPPHYRLCNNRVQLGFLQYIVEPVWNKLVEILPDSKSRK